MTQRSTLKFLQRLLKQENKMQLSDHSSEFNHILLGYYRNFVKNHQDYIYIVSLDGELVSKNKDVFSHLGYVKNQATSYKEIMSKEDYNLLKQSYKRARKGAESEAEISLFKHDGNLEHFLVSFSTLKSSEQYYAGVYIVAQHKTKEKELKEKISRTNEFYQMIFDNLEVGIWVRDQQQNKLLFVSKGLEEMLNISKEEIYNSNLAWFDLVPTSYHSLLLSNYELLKEGQRVTQTYQMNGRKDKFIWVYEEMIPQHNDQGEVVNVFGLMMDISENINLKTEISYLLNHDQVTSLPNEYKMLNDLDKLINKRHHPFSFISVSINNFEWYNNSLGMLISEKMLKTVSDKLVKTIPKGATLYKTSLHEFACIIAQYESKDDVFACVEKMINIVKQMFKVDNYQIILQASVGVSFFPEHGEDKDELIRNTYSALYHAKKMGAKNYKIFSYDRDVYSLKKYMLQEDLINALKENEFELYYQPIVDIDSNKIIWGEALIRWNHKEWGIVSPKEFIGIAEEQHLIHDITDWAIEESCKQIKAWESKQIDISPLSINISPLRFLKNDIVEVLASLMKKYQINSKYIILEITENIPISSESIFSEMLESIKQLGIKIALDDFGSGYTSFQYLHHFDFDILKVDKSFIRNMGDDYPKNKMIIAAMINLAKSLNIQVVAEGVEEENQLNFLKENDCDFVQGYMYSPPVRANEFSLLLETKRIKPKSLNLESRHELERREYFRFHFPGSLVAQMNIVELNNKKVNVGSTIILVDNISLGGMKFYSFLKLPSNPQMVLRFKLRMMDKEFLFHGMIVRTHEERTDLFSYGVSFIDVSEAEKDQLAEVINRMTALQNMKQSIPNTEITKLSPIKFLEK